MTAPLRLEALVKRFGRSVVVDHVDLEIGKGCIYGLLGPNGAGKTTTIKILMNLLRPSAGRAEVLGTDSRRLGPRHLTRIGYVAETQEMPDWMTVAAFLSYCKPFYPDWDDTSAAALLRDFALPADRKLRHLSRGMRMKAALVSALAYHPELLLMDEPFSGLDPLVREDLIQGLQTGAGERTVLLSSHDLGEMETFATHIGYMDGGRLQFSEELGSLRSRFRHVEVTLPRAELTGEWPEHWWRPEIREGVVRFIETRFDAQRTTEMVRERFAATQQVTLSPLPLRTIFIALARHTGKNG